MTPSEYREYLYKVYSKIPVEVLLQYYAKNSYCFCMSQRWSIEELHLLVSIMYLGAISDKPTVERYIGKRLVPNNKAIRRFLNFNLIAIDGNVFEVTSKGLDVIKEFIWKIKPDNTRLANIMIVKDKIEQCEIATRAMCIDTYIRNTKKQGILETTDRLFRKAKRKPIKKQI